MLLDRDADVGAVDRYGSTALHYAAKQSGQVRVASTLIDKGVSINATDRNGRTALHNAARADNISHNPSGETALNRASRLGDEFLVGLLLDKGADINA